MAHGTKTQWRPRIIVQILFIRLLHLKPLRIQNKSYVCCSGKVQSVEDITHISNVRCTFYKAPCHNTQAFSPDSQQKNQQLLHLKGKKCEEAETAVLIKAVPWQLAAVLALPPGSPVRGKLRTQRNETTRGEIQECEWHFCWPTNHRRYCPISA